MNIFTINQTLLSILSLIEENEGEITPELEQELNQVTSDLNHKIEDYTHVIKQLESDINCINEETKRLANIKKIKENTIKGLKRILAMTINEFGDTSKSGSKYIDYGTGKVSIRKTNAVEENEDITEHICLVLFNTLQVMKECNTLNLGDELDVDYLLEKINENIDIKITKEDFKYLIGNINFDFNIQDLITNDFYWFKAFVERGIGFKLKPKVDKNQIKTLLPENQPVFAKVVQNESVIIK